MKAKIIDGKAIAAQVRSELKKEIDRLKAKAGISPGLAVILAGNNPASEIYVKHKEKACESLGVYSEIHRLDENVSTESIIEAVERLNGDKKIHGILVQLPLPKQVDRDRILKAVKPSKDVDGFHPFSLGSLLSDKECFLPCTPQGIIELLNREKIEIRGKKAVVVGRSIIVGKPVALLLLKNHATVTICHSRTADLAEVTRQADILVAAIGHPKFITGAMIKKGAVVIDVGINRIEGKLCGDVDFDSAKETAGAITPVPGGVGPMTIAMLMKNTLKAAVLAHGS